uniref:T-box domain-containing protein n=1 Tax=Romanomermis culicivorax TaxID=13658 RepID=A0A915KQB5_ROMCU
MFASYAGSMVSGACFFSLKKIVLYFSFGESIIKMCSESIKIELLNAEIWECFHQYETEMTVTKQGRRMFPTLRYKISGLDPNATYALELRMVASDGFRRKYQNCRWILCGKYCDFRAAPSNSEKNDAGDNGEVDLKQKIAAGPTYQHPDSPARGSLWTKQDVSFHKMKLTNNADSADKGGILLSSMRKYIPVLAIFRTHDSVKNREKVLVACKSFDETSFIAVTSYQNPKITDLKVKNNPFAKGFRHLRKNLVFDSESINFASILNRHDDHDGDSATILEQTSFSNKKRKFEEIVSSPNNDKKTPSDVFVSNNNFETITPSPSNTDFLEKSQIVPQTPRPPFSNSNYRIMLPASQIPRLSSVPTLPFPPLFPIFNCPALSLPGLLTTSIFPFFGSSSNFSPSFIPPFSTPHTSANLPPFTSMDFTRFFMSDISAFMSQYYRTTSSHITAENGHQL